MRLTQAQAQDVADAAATAAMYTLRNERSRPLATQAAQRTCAVNAVAGAPPSCPVIQFGDFVGGSFIANNNNAAVRVQASRTGDASPGLFFARLWGNDTFAVAADAVAAARPLEVVIVLDITVSWDPLDFELARAAAVGMLDTLSLTAGFNDRIGLVAFNGPLGYEITPMLDLQNVADVAAARAQWQNLQLASRAGDRTLCPWPARCNGLHYTFESPYHDDFEFTTGGFYPQMPRNYNREANTDFLPGLMMAQTMFNAGSLSAFRAMVVLTDGQAVAVPSEALDARTASGWVEDRFRFVTGPVPHAENDIVADTIDRAQLLWDTQRVHTWMISFVQDNIELAPVAQGRGYYERVDDPEDLVVTFQNIAESLPIVLRE